MKSFKDLNLQISYTTLGEESLANSLIVPTLKCAKVYKRSVGFFSSGVLDTILDSLPTFVRNGGKIMLIASPHLSQEDVEAINLGYEHRKAIIENCFTKDFEREIERLTDDRLKLLEELIATEIVEIRIAVVTENSIGLYHDKLGIMEDHFGNKIVFSGSANSSSNAYTYNYDKVRVFKSWDLAQNLYVLDDEKEFDTLWANENPYLESFDYQEAAKATILKINQSRRLGKRNGGSIIKLRDYQEEAKQAWINNDYNGFLVMATGTGKTWTAIFSAKDLCDKERVNIVICAPYKHLIKQWEGDLNKLFTDSKIILASSENPDWETEITNEYLWRKYNGYRQLIICVTMKSFASERFKKVMAQFEENNLLIVDEAHRFNYSDPSIPDRYKYKLGLSATPFKGKSATSGHELMKFFGGRVYNLPIEKALELKCLVPYNYYPLFVYSSEKEEAEFTKYTSVMASCFKNGKCIDAEKMAKAYRSRLRVIAMAEEKITMLESLIKETHVKDHFIVYCGDGKVFDDDGDAIRHISIVKEVLDSLDYKTSQFTAKENMKTRMELVEAFNTRAIDALVAIKCLDEGINIPSITDALILASNDDYREFVQRRGRILRKFEDKEYANIYDVIVLPSLGFTEWAKIEFRRFNEYAKLAMNCSEQEAVLSRYLDKYGLSLEEIDVFDFENMEDDLDE